MFLTTSVGSKQTGKNIKIKKKPRQNVQEIDLHTCTYTPRKHTYVRDKARDIHKMGINTSLDINTYIHYIHTAIVVYLSVNKQ
jgi:hypothetical protein